MSDSDVLIVGAGPTGLVLALWLTKLGVKVRIVDRTSGPGTTSRAMAVQARTLELYRQVDLARAVTDAANKVRQVHLWVRGKEVARVPFGEIGGDLTPFGFMYVFPQDAHERLLVERLERLGVIVERETELLSFVDDGEAVTAQLRTTPGEDKTCFCRFLAGCDGARSQVREATGIGFPGGTYQQTFYVADVVASGAAINDDLNVDLDQADFAAIFPMAGKGRIRLIGAIRDQAAAAPRRPLQFKDVSHRAIDGMKLDVQKVNWFSTYHVHHRVAEHFRRGRAFLLGDAAHVHSPAGGQGMNTGIGDAINLAWKMAAVISGQAPDRWLDSYEAERAPFARRLVATTDRAFGFVSAEGPLADALRTRLAPLLLPRVLSIEAAQEYIFRTISQLTLNYRGGPLSRGVAGHVHGGDRLPWVSEAGVDNHASLSAMTWQAHVYGGASAELKNWCAENAVALHQFRWSERYQSAGLAQDAVYLLRPDTYVAVADAKGSIAALDGYASDTGLRFQRPNGTSPAWPLRSAG